MGGKCIENAVRLNAKEYHSLWYDVIHKTNHTKFLVRSYREKETFGDMDILTHNTKNPLFEFKREILVDAGLEVVEEVKNGSVTSYGVKLPQGIFQIDIISLPIEEIPFAYHYFAWNDCGNLIGRLARGVGLKFGHNGLWYTQRNEHTILHEHRLTLDFYEAIEYLGLDKLEFALGFETMEEVFDFIMSSKYYDWQRFDLTQRNHRARVRDNKRENYRKFLEYAEGKPYKCLPPKDSFLEQHFEQWPEFKVKYFEVKKKDEENQVIKSKLNGNIVSELTGLTGKELGIFMSKIKMFISREDLLNYQQVWINDTILHMYREMGNE